MWEDPIVAEVRAVREQLAAKFNFEVHAIFADLRQRQGSLGGRLIRLDKRADPNRHSGPPGPASSDAAPAA